MVQYEQSAQHNFTYPTAIVPYVFIEGEPRQCITNSKIIKFGILHQVKLLIIQYYDTKHVHVHNYNLCIYRPFTFKDESKICRL